MACTFINPESLGAPRGYANGVLTDAGGRLLFVAGQIAWDETQRVVSSIFVEQFDRALSNVIAVVTAAGGRPDLSVSSELRVKLDPWIESTEQLAPLIDPNLHSCGTVRPHGHRELAHPEARFYMVGAKSYGRAPNFLLATGHEQVRSVVAALAGDFVAADDVQLELPETGVCSTQFDEASAGCCSNEPAEAIAVKTSSCGASICGTAPVKTPDPIQATSATKSSCCGGAPLKREDACCVADEIAKDAGAAGCASKQRIGA